MFKTKESKLDNGVLIRARESFIDFLLILDGKIISKLMLSKNEGPFSNGIAEINIDDIVGVKQRGYGTILMNEAIKYLKENHSRLAISGIISNVDDKFFDIDEQKILKGKRKNFFRKFGFLIEEREPEDFDRIYSKIKDLKSSYDKK